MLKVQEASLDWALEHVSRRGDTDILPLPIEYAAISNDWDSIRHYLASHDLDQWAVRPSRKMLTPKHGLGFRIATQLDPLDTLLVCALVYEIGSEFEGVRVPTSERRVFSYRFLPAGDGQLYDPGNNYESFRSRSLDLAGLSETSYVVMTDIADFFPRLYSHPMENAMRAATTGPDHARVITKLIAAWNMGVSYGVPVGPSPFRLIAEVTISDVDQALLAEGINFCRFSDDYRLFVGSERAAREGLAFLANALFRNHGFTLQESKTEIVPGEDFVARFARAERDQERHALQSSFSGLAEALGLTGQYEPVRYEDLDAQQKSLVDSLNLWVIVLREAEAERALDVPLIRFTLGRISQLGLRDVSGLLVQHLERFYPVFREVVEALVAQSGLTTSERQTLGGQLLDLFDHPVVGYLEYHRDWLLTPFVDKAIWDHTDRLIQLHQKYFDHPTQRAITLALGRGKVWHWFKTRKQEVFQLSPWNRRAFLYAASCLPGDEARHWYQSLTPQLDMLERAVVKYARAHPIA